MTDDFVTLATYRFPAEAEAAKMFLEEAGVTVFLADAETVNMDWLLGNAIGYVKLQVPRSQTQQAEELLQGFREVRKEREKSEQSLGEDEDAPLSCLACGAPMREDVLACPACGWSYATNAEG